MSIGLNYANSYKLHSTTSAIAFFTTAPLPTYKLLFFGFDWIGNKIVNIKPL